MKSNGLQVTTFQYPNMIAFCLNKRTGKDVIMFCDVWKAFLCSLFKCVVSASEGQIIFSGSRRARRSHAGFLAGRARNAHIAHNFVKQQVLDVHGEKCLSAPNLGAHPCTVQCQ